MRYLTTGEIYSEFWGKVVGMLAAGIIVIILQGCQPAQPYQYIQGPTGQNMVVVHDNGNDVLMDALIFQSLMSNGDITT